MNFEFLNPVTIEKTFVNQLSEFQLGKKILIHTKDEFPKLENFKIAIVGVKENRGWVGYENDTVNLNYIRKEIYRLHTGNWEVAIADLGDVEKGDGIEDTYYALQSICSHLIKNQITPIVIGGSQDLTYSMYRAYDSLEKMVSFTSVDAKFDIEFNAKLASNSYLSKIILNEPNNLYNFTNIGYQTYYNSQEEIDLLDKMFFDTYRLGKITQNIETSEPIMRNSDLVSIDLTSIKSSDSGNYKDFSPNGFNGFEICAQARYAGLSQAISSFGIFNHHSSKQEAVLISQIVWYFIEGFNQRIIEIPDENNTDFVKYMIPLDDIQMVFYKSNKTEKWWMQVPKGNFKNNIFERNTLLACSKEEYLESCNGEIPLRWWKAQSKLLV